MTPTTPSGVRTREIARPFGRVQPAISAPTGSGNAAMARRPSAMALIRSSVSVSRSTKEAAMPIFSARARSAAFSARIVSQVSMSTSAAASSAAFLAAVGAIARTRADARARSPIACIRASSEPFCVTASSSIVPSLLPSFEPCRPIPGNPVARSPIRMIIPQSLSVLARRPCPARQTAGQLSKRPQARRNSASSSAATRRFSIARSSRWITALRPS